MWKKMAVVLVLMAGCAAAWALTDEQRGEIEERIRPVGDVCVQGDANCGAQVASAGGESKSPEEIYNTNCSACHASGVGGAPKQGDAAAWSGRLDKGKDTLYTNAINGFNAMPPKGTCMSCSDEEIKATVDYMLEQSQ